MNKGTLRGLVAGISATGLALGLAACSPAAAPTTAAPAPTTTTTVTAAPAPTTVTINWWHNTTTGDGLQLWKDVAAEFEAANPGVRVEQQGYESTVLQRQLIPAALQAGGDAAPDVFMVWPGGEARAQAQAGYLKDLTSSPAVATLGGSVKPWEVDGKVVGLPFTFGITGIWYNKDLFAQAGITATPTTLDELNAAVTKLKAINTIPIAVGGGSGYEWAAAHWWYMFAVKLCSTAVLQSAIPALDFSDPCWTDAGTQLQAFIATDPFEKDWASTPAQKEVYSSAGLVANGKAAMEFMGHWNEGVIGSLTPDQKIPSFLGWFPFPGITGGKGDPTAAMGGGDAWAVYKDAPDEAVKFVEYLVSDDVQKRFAAIGGGVPTNPAGAEGLTSESLKSISAGLAGASFVQLWLDSALGADFGTPMNAEIVKMMANKATPQDVVKVLEDTAAKVKK